MNINNQPDTIETFYIHLLSSVEAAFQKFYEDYVEGGLYGQTLAKIALGKKTRETMIVKDVECENVVYVPSGKSL